MGEGQYEYIHEFKERIDEILWLQRKHHEIIDSDKEPMTIKQTSLAELHRLDIKVNKYTTSFSSSTISIHFMLLVAGCRHTMMICPI